VKSVSNINLILLFEGDRLSRVLLTVYSWLHTLGKRHALFQRKYITAIMFCFNYFLSINVQFFVYIYIYPNSRMYSFTLNPHSFYIFVLSKVLQYPSRNDLYRYHDVITDTFLATWSHILFFHQKKQRALSLSLSLSLAIYIYNIMYLEYNFPGIFILAINIRLDTAIQGM